MSNLPLLVRWGYGVRSGERLANQPDSFLNRAVSYLTSAGGEVSCPVLPCKGVENRHRIPVQDE